MLRSSTQLHQTLQLLGIRRWCPLLNAHRFHCDRFYHPRPISDPWSPLGAVFSALSGYLNLMYSYSPPPSKCMVLARLPKFFLSLELGDILGRTCRRHFRCTCSLLASSRQPGTFLTHPATASASDYHSIDHRSVSHRPTGAKVFGDDAHQDRGGDQVIGSQDF